MYSYTPSHFRGSLYHFPRLVGNLLAISCETHLMLDLALGKKIGEFLVGGDLERFFSPKIWGKVSVGLCQSGENGLDEVTHGTGVSTCRGVAVVNSSHVKQLFWNRGSDKSSPTRGRDQTHTNGAALSS
jgi:hypothetical protein